MEWPPEWALTLRACTHPGRLSASLPLWARGSGPGCRLRGPREAHRPLAACCSAGDRRGSANRKDGLGTQCLFRLPAPLAKQAMLMTASWGTDPTKAAQPCIQPRALFLQRTRSLPGRLLGPLSCLLPLPSGYFWLGTQGRGRLTVSLCLLKWQKEGWFWCGRELTYYCRPDPRQGTWGPDTWLGNGVCVRVSGSGTEDPGIGDSEHRKACSHSSGRLTWDLAVGEAGFGPRPLSWLEDAIFPLCPHMVLPRCPSVSWALPVWMPVR